MFYIWKTQSPILISIILVMFIDPLQMPRFVIFENLWISPIPFFENILKGRKCYWVKAFANTFIYPDRPAHRGLLDQWVHLVYLPLVEAVTLF